MALWFFNIKHFLARRRTSCARAARAPRNIICFLASFCIARTCAASLPFLHFIFCRRHTTLFDGLPCLSRAGAPRQVAAGTVR
jgi:hypothetical protein